MARKVRKKLGEILIEQGSVTEDAISKAESVASESGKRLGEALVDDARRLAAQCRQRRWRSRM